jgi:hypothetical protein
METICKEARHYVNKFFMAIDYDQPKASKVYPIFLVVDKG